jgi:hypothetical protein
MVEEKLWGQAKKFSWGAPVFHPQRFNTLETGYTNIKSMRLTLMT